jgi:hypothetical protein
MNFQTDSKGQGRKIDVGATGNVGGQILKAGFDQIGEEICHGEEIAGFFLRGFDSPASVFGTGGFKHEG